MTQVSRSLRGSVWRKVMALCSDWSVQRRRGGGLIVLGLRGAPTIKSAVAVSSDWLPGAGVTQMNRDVILSSSWKPEAPDFLFFCFFYNLSFFSFCFSQRDELYSNPRIWSRGTDWLVNSWLNLIFFQSESVGNSRK